VEYRGGVMMLAAEDAHALVSAATRANVIFIPSVQQGWIWVSTWT
jgi:hypothetical protein